MTSMELNFENIKQFSLDFVLTLNSDISETFEEDLMSVLIIIELTVAFDVINHQNLVRR